MVSPGRVAQRESARFTRGRSLVRSQARPFSRPPGAKMARPTAGRPWASPTRRSSRRRRIVRQRRPGTRSVEDRARKPCVAHESRRATCRRRAVNSPMVAPTRAEAPSGTARNARKARPPALTSSSRLKSSLETKSGARTRTQASRPTIIPREFAAHAARKRANGASEPKRRSGQQAERLVECCRGRADVRGRLRMPQEDEGEAEGKSRARRSSPGRFGADRVAPRPLTVPDSNRRLTRKGPRNGEVCADEPVDHVRRDALSSISPAY